MALEQTFSMIKPDAVKKNHIGAIIERLEKNGLRIAAAKMLTLDKAKAEGFYAEHKGKGFFDGLISFMTSGPAVLLVLEGENAVAKYREVLGATNPANAAPGTIRKDFAASIDNNAAHGSDSPESAKREISYFFFGSEIVNGGR